MLRGSIADIINADKRQTAVRVVFLLVGPERSAGEHCKALSRIARLARSDALRTRLMQAGSGDEFVRALADAEAG